MASSKGDESNPTAELRSFAQQALDVAKMARRANKSLAGDNYYGNKLASLKGEALELFEDFSAKSTGDTTALAELIEIVFSPRAVSGRRLESFRELDLLLRTTWKKSARQLSAPAATFNFFPPSVLEDTKRPYIISIGRQMNGCYASGLRDACAVMMRRLLEIGIIEVFEHRGIAHKIKGAGGNYVHLSELIDILLAEPTIHLTRNTKSALPRLKNAGHLSAHGRYYLAKPDDLERAHPDFRVAMEEMLHQAGLQ